MDQSKLGSLIESIIQTAVGFIGSIFIVWPAAAWATGIDYNGGQQFGVVLIFTVWSIGRGYAVRRWANRRIHSASVCLSVWLARLVA